MPQDDQGLGRDTKTREILITVVACLVLVGLGAAMLYMGMTFEEPAERLATRSVPAIAPIALSIGGVIVALGGSALVIFGKQRRLA